MGRSPCGSAVEELARADVDVEAEAEAEAVLMLKVDSEVRVYESPEVPTVDENPGGLRDLLYLEPGIPGLVGSSRLLGFFDITITTRCMSGRNWGSPCVHSNPIWMHIATCSRFADGAMAWSMISKAWPFL